MLQVRQAMGSLGPPASSIFTRLHVTELIPQKLRAKYKIMGDAQQSDVATTCCRSARHVVARWRKIYLSTENFLCWSGSLVS